MLLDKKAPEIFPKHKGCFFILEFFAFKQYIFVPLTNKKLLLSLQWRLKQNFLFDFAK